VIGYGLDFGERYRNLPYVAVLSDELIPKLRSFDKFFRSAAFPLVIIAVLVRARGIRVAEQAAEDVAVDMVGVSPRDRTDAECFSHAGVSEDRDHQSLSATIIWSEGKVDYPAPESLVSSST
jgi:hypothetical protein